jgi:hypothetical protein
LGLEQILQLGCQVEDATLEILCRAGVEPNLTQLQVDLPLLQRQDLAVDAPTGNVRKRHHRLHGRRQVPEYCHVMLALEEPGTHVVLS